MSLTTFVEMPEISKSMLETWPKPDFELEGAIKSPPLTRNYAVVGTAFDYLMRFYLKREYPNAEEKTWVAEISTKPEILFPVVEIARKSGIGEDPAILATAIVERARKDYQSFLATGKLKTELLKSAIGLAKVDAIYRAGYLDPNLGRIDPLDIEDLSRLYDAIPRDKFSGKSKVWLNPIFSKASLLVGGADADLVLDSELVDIKTTKYLELKTRDWLQLVGYATLASIAKNEFQPIKHISIYFSRYGVLWTYPTKEIYESQKYSVYQKWFEKKAAQIFPHKT